MTPVNKQQQQQQQQAVKAPEDSALAVQFYLKTLNDNIVELIQTVRTTNSELLNAVQDLDATTQEAVTIDTKILECNSEPAIPEAT